MTVSSSNMLWYHHCLFDFLLHTDVNNVATSYSMHVTCNHTVKEEEHMFAQLQVASPPPPSPAYPPFVTKLIVHQT